MSETSELDSITALIESTWGRSAAELERRAIHRPADDPLLRAAMRMRGAVQRADYTITDCQQQLESLTRPGTAPSPFDPKRITEAGIKIQVALGERRTALAAVHYIVDAKTAALNAPADQQRRAQAATARSDLAPRPLGLSADAPAAPARPASAVPAVRPHR